MGMSVVKVGGRERREKVGKEEGYLVVFGCSAES